MSSSKAVSTIIIFSLAASNYTAYARLLIDGHPSNPFSINTLPPPGFEEDRVEIVRGRSQRQYAQPVQKVQSSIERELVTTSR